MQPSVPETVPVLKSWTVEDGELVVVLDGVTTRIAAGPDTEALIAAMAESSLDPDELEWLKLVVGEWGGVNGLIVRERRAEGV